MAINVIWSNHHSNCVSAMTEMAITPRFPPYGCLCVLNYQHMHVSW